MRLVACIKFAKKCPPAIRPPHGYTIALLSASGCKALFGSGLTLGVGYIHAHGYIVNVLLTSRLGILPWTTLMVNRLDAPARQVLLENCLSKVMRNIISFYMLVTWKVEN